MLIFDQLKKNDPQLRALAVAIVIGLFILVAGLWWVQIVSSRDYQANFQTQSFRTVRIPALRGRIFDRNGEVLAENRAAYNLNLYLEELRKSFGTNATVKAREARQRLGAARRAREKELRRGLNKEERKAFAFTLKQKVEVDRIARYEVTSNLVTLIGQRLQLPLSLNPTNLEKHYQQSLALPMPIWTN